MYESFCDEYRCNTAIFPGTLSLGQCLFRIIWGGVTETLLDMQLTRHEEKNKTVS